MFNLCWAKHSVRTAKLGSGSCIRHRVHTVRLRVYKWSVMPTRPQTHRIQTLRGSITFIEPFNLPYNETKNVSVDERKCLPLYKYDANSPSVHLGPKRLAAHCSNNHKAKERLHKKQSKTPEQRMTRYPNQPSSTFIQPK